MALALAFHCAEYVELGVTSQGAVQLDAKLIEPKSTFAAIHADANARSFGDSAVAKWITHERGTVINIATPRGFN